MLFCELDPELPASPSGQGRAAVVNGLTDSVLGKFSALQNMQSWFLYPLCRRIYSTLTQKPVSSAFYVIWAVY